MCAWRFTRCGRRQGDNSAQCSACSDQRTNSQDNGPYPTLLGRGNSHARGLSRGNAVHLGRFRSGRSHGPLRLFILLWIRLIWIRLVWIRRNCRGGRLGRRCLSRRT